MNDLQNPAPDPTTDPVSEDRKRRLTIRFIGEMTILLAGVCIGFFWSHYAEDVSNEANIIMMLLLIIIGLVRYIYLTRK